MSNLIKSHMQSEKHRNLLHSRVGAKFPTHAPPADEDKTLSNTAKIIDIANKITTSTDKIKETTLEKSNLLTDDYKIDYFNPKTQKTEPFKIFERAPSKGIIKDKFRATYKRIQPNDTAISANALKLDKDRVFNGDLDLFNKALDDSNDINHVLATSLHQSSENEVIVNLSKEGYSDKQVSHIFNLDRDLVRNIEGTEFKDRRFKFGRIQDKVPVKPNVEISDFGYDPNFDDVWEKPLEVEMERSAVPFPFNTRSNKNVIRDESGVYRWLPVDRETRMKYLAGEDILDVADVEKSSLDASIDEMLDPDNQKRLKLLYEKQQTDPDFVNPTDILDSEQKSPLKEYFKKYMEDSDSSLLTDDNTIFDEMAKNNVSFPQDADKALEVKNTYNDVYNYASENFENPSDHMPSVDKFIDVSDDAENANGLISNFENLGWTSNDNINAKDYNNAGDFFKDALSATENIDDTGTSLGVLNKTTALLDEVSDKSKQYVIDNASNIATDAMKDGTKVIENLDMVSNIGKDLAKDMGKDLAEEGAKEAGKGVPILGVGLAATDVAMTFSDEESSAMDKIGSTVDLIGAAGADLLPPFAMLHGAVKGIDLLEDLLT